MAFYGQITGAIMIFPIVLSQAPTENRRKRRCIFGMFSDQGALPNDPLE
jgi:hypothetical protein